jgi:hypothetical protein
VRTRGKILQWKRFLFRFQVPSSSSSGGRAFCGMREGLSDPVFRFLKRGPYSM